ncbi:MAG: hypothetical protein VYD19_02680 [Myxococcota bacterium]|nr:hypothetical protein [Myxococcota bacterium]
MKPLLRSADSRFVRLLGLYLTFLLLTVGCGDRAEAPAPSAPPPPQPFTLEGDADQLSAPEGVISFGGINLLGESFDALNRAFRRLMGPDFDLRTLYLDNFTRSAFLFRSDQVHERRPIRFAQVVLDGELHWLRLIGVKDPAAIRSSFAPLLSPREDEAPPQDQIYTQRRYPDDPSPNFMRFDDSVFAFSSDRRLLGPDWRNFRRSLLKVKLVGIGGLYFYPSQALSWVGDLREKSVAALTALESRPARRALAEAEGKPRLLKRLQREQRRREVRSRQLALTIALTDALEWAGGASRWLRLAFLLEADRFKLDLRWIPRAGSVLERRFSALANFEGHPLLGEFSGESPAVASLKLPPAELQSLFSGLHHFLLRQSLSRDGESAPDAFHDWLKALRKLLEGIGGEAAMSAHLEAPSAEALSAAEAEAEALKPLPAPKPKSQLRWSARMALAQPAGEVQKSWEALRAFYQRSELKRQLQKRGVWAQLSQSKEQLAGAAHQVVRIRGKMPRPPKLLRPIRKGLRQLYDARFTFAKERAVVGFGGSALKTLESYLSGTLPGVEPLNTRVEIQGALQAAAQAPFFFLWFDPIRFVRSLDLRTSGFGPAAIIYGLLGRLEGGSGVALSAGVREGALQLVLDIPLKLIEELYSGFSGVLAPSTPAPKLPTQVPAVP